MRRGKFLKRIIICLIAVFFIGSNNTQTASADAISDYTSYTIGTKESGALLEDGPDRYYYKFTIPTSGKINITGTMYMEDIRLRIYDLNADELWNRKLEWNSTSELISVAEEIYLTSGTYYFCVEKYGFYGSYNFNIQFTSSNESFIETNGGSNNSIDDAYIVNTNGTDYTAQLAINDTKDFWKFNLKNSGTVNFDAIFYDIEYVFWKLYDENGIELLSRRPYWNETTNNINVDEDLFLTSGTYYISVSHYSGYGKYNFKLLYTSSNETYMEKNGGTNNTVSEASDFSLGNVYNGQIAINDEKDFYKVNISSAGKYVVSLDSLMENVYIKIYDTDGSEVFSDTAYKNSVTEKISYSESVELKKGIYYIAIVKYRNYGDYTLSMNKLTKQNCPHKDYDSKWYDSTYFSKGYNKYTCKECGYSYKADYQPVKKLSQGYMYSYCDSGKGWLSVSWSTISDASGYEIRYSRDKSMKSGVKTKKIAGQSNYKATIGKLFRNRKYYLQVRAYKTEGSKTVYGKWSEKRCFKTK